MTTVLIVAYLLIVVALIAVILLQRSEGGGLGMGTSSNGLISVRGSANLLTRITAVLATLFFVLAIALTLVAELDRGTGSIVDKVNQNSAQPGAEPASVLDALKQLQQGSAPATDGAAAPATTTTPATTAPATTTAPAASTDATTAPAPTTDGAAMAPATTGTAPAADTATPAAPAPAATNQPAAPSN